MRLLSRPVEIYWAGWRTTTLDLAKAGWQLSVDQDIRHQRMALAMQLEIDKRTFVRGIALSQPFSYYHMRSEHDSFNAPLVDVKLDFLGNYIQVHTTEPVKLLPADPLPSISYGAIHSLEDLAHFKTVNPDTNQILLEQASLDDVLSYALQRQAPNQERIRKELVKRKEMEEYRRASDLRAELRLVV